MVVLWQERYAEGTKQMLQNWFDGKEFPEKWYIVREGELAEQYKWFGQDFSEDCLIHQLHGCAAFQCQILLSWYSVTFVEMCELCLSGCCHQFWGFSAYTDSCVLYWRLIPTFLMDVIMISQNIGKSLSRQGKGWTAWCGSVEFATSSLLNS